MSPYSVSNPTLPRMLTADLVAPVSAPSTALGQAQSILLCYDTPNTHFSIHT